MSQSQEDRVNELAKMISFSLSQEQNEITEATQFICNRRDEDLTLLFYDLYIIFKTDITDDTYNIILQSLNLFSFLISPSEQYNSSNFVPAFINLPDENYANILVRVRDLIIQDEKFKNICIHILSQISLIKIDYFDTIIFAFFNDILKENTNGDHVTLAFQTATQILLGKPQFPYSFISDFFEHVCNFMSLDLELEQNTLILRTYYSFIQMGYEELNDKYQLLHQKMRELLDIYTNPPDFLRVEKGAQFNPNIPELTTLISNIYSIIEAEFRRLYFLNNLPETIYETFIEPFIQSQNIEIQVYSLFCLYQMLNFEKEVEQRFLVDHCRIFIYK